MASAETLTTLHPWKNNTTLPTARKRVTILQPLVYDHSTTISGLATQTLASLQPFLYNLFTAVTVGVYDEY